MPEETLKQKTARGLFWGFVNNGSMQFLNLLFGIFLGRILSPEDYGMVGMLTIFSLIAGSLQESGFIAALANKKEVKHEEYNAVFWFSTSISFCLYWILFFLAPLIADFYNEPKLIPLARYAFLGFFISSLGIIPSAYLFRTLQVRQRSIATILALGLSGIVGVTLAFNGFSYWSLATQSLVYISILTAYVWHVCPWRPTFTWSFRPIRAMLGFSSKLLFTNIFIHINNNLFSVILGRFYGEKEVGQFNQANNWNYRGHSLISGMVGGVAQPVLAQINNEPKRQVRAFRKMLRFTAFISFPAMFGLSLVAPELITIAITDKWLASARILQILAIGGAFIPIAGLYTNLLISKGKSNIYLWNTILLGVLQLIVMLVLCPYGIYTMVCVYVSINVVWLFIWHYLVYKEIKLNLLHVLKDVLPYAGIALLVMAFTYWVTIKMENIYLSIIAKIFIAASLYTSIMWLSGSATFKECLGYLRRKK